MVGGATTTGNKIHTLAITGDLTTGTSPFGSDSNHLKTIQLNDDGKFTINSQDVFFSVTTKTNNEGTAIFNTDNGFTDDLGGEGLSLRLVQFSSNKGTVKGDTYAKDITIDTGKSAVFTGYNSRSLNIPSATVGGVKVPRATTKFNYKTKIFSENFTRSNSSSSAEYTGQTGNTNSDNIVLASGSTFDLSNVSSIKIFLTAQNNPSAIGHGSAYPVISGGSIIVGNAASLPFNITANEGGFVRWQITGNSFVLLPIEPTGDVTIDNIINILIHTPVSNVILNTPVGQRREVVEHLLPIIQRPSNEIHRITTHSTYYPNGSFRWSECWRF